MKLGGAEDNLLLISEHRGHAITVEFQTDRVRMCTGRQKYQWVVKVSQPIDIIATMMVPKAGLEPARA